MSTSADYDGANYVGSTQDDSESKEMRSELGKLVNSQGKIMIAALDHRGSIAKELPTKRQMQDWKRRMVELYRDEVTGILIDPIYGTELVEKEAKCAWMVSLEKTGYRGSKQARVTEILEGWGVKQAKAAGYSAVKLLLYFDPSNRELSEQQKKLAMRVAKECQREGMIYLLEPLTYCEENVREERVLAMVRELREIPVDIWKFEYPGSVAGCREISALVTPPWVLLSAGLIYPRYEEALKEAVIAGASGFAVGRALWQEFGEYQGEEREKFFTQVALPRIRKLKEIVANA